MSLDLPVQDATAAVTDDRQLTRAALLRLELYAPPSDLTPYITTFFRMRCAERTIRDVQPSSIGMMAVMARGGGTIRFLDGRVEPSHRFTLMTPTSAAATFEVDGPWDVFGATLAPLGWVGLTGLSAAEHGNRLYDGAVVLAPALTEAAERVAAGFDAMSPEAMIAAFAAAIRASLRPVNARHANFVRTVAQWLAETLSPDVTVLEQRCGYGSRQIQRLADRYFGLPPSALARKYRALRAAVMLSRPDVTPDEIAAVEDHFYDQSHMIREMRLFAGRTPARIADPDAPYLSAIMNLRNFRESGPRMAPIPRNLRG